VTQQHQEGTADVFERGLRRQGIPATKFLPLKQDRQEGRTESSARVKEDGATRKQIKGEDSVLCFP